MPTDDQLSARGKRLAGMYIDINDIGDLETMTAIVEHSIVNAYRIGYRSREGEQRAQRAAAMRRVAAVLNDRRGFHVDDFDAASRDDLLGAIVDAVLAEFVS